MTTLAENYRVCCGSWPIVAASNFYYTFYLLPRPKRLAMCAVYAYLRANWMILPMHHSIKINCAIDPTTIKLNPILMGDEIVNCGTHSPEQLARLVRLEECYGRFQAALPGDQKGEILPAAR